MMQRTLASRLQVLRARRGWTIMEASEQLGLNRHTLSRLEGGTQRPYGPTLKKLAEGYGVSVEELMEGEPAAPKAKAPSSPLEPSFNDVLKEEERRRTLNVYLALYTPITLLAERWERVVRERDLSEPEAEAMVDDYNAMFAAMVEAERRLGDIPHAEFEQAGAEVAQAMQRFYDVTEMAFEKAAADNVYDLQALRAKRDCAGEAQEEGGSEATA